ncbi:hypothetical protein CH368_19315 [Leptospira levettii]|nr:hypothetical protein CH368_19315 [Leptospira levettii]
MHSFIKEIFLVFIFLSIVQTIYSKEKNPFSLDYNNDRINYIIDCEEKKQCYESCNNIQDISFLFQFLAKTKDPNLNNQVRNSCLNDCSRIFCYKK